MIDVLQALEELYAEGGDAFELRKEAQLHLVSPGSSHAPHDIGYYRGVMDGLARLRLRVEERERQRRETPPVERRAPREAKPPRRVH